MNKNKSFTLIELLVVIVIIGILAGVIMISTSSSIDKANVAKIKVFEESVQNNLAANMVSRWTLDEIISTNQTPDQWGNNTGILNGADGLPQLRPASECVTDGCFKFDGVDDYIDCGKNSSLNITDKITISAWVKLNIKTDYQSIVRKANDGGNQYVLYLTDTMHPYFNSFDTSWHTYTGTIPVKANIWTYVAVSYNGAKISFYVDSIIAGIFNGSFPLKSPSSPTALLIGGNSYHLKGYVGDIRLYDAALSSSQIKQNYIAGLDSLLSKNLISKEEYNQRIKGLSSK